MRLINNQTILLEMWV